MTLDPRFVIYGLNAAFIVVVLYVSARMTGAGVTYMWNPGDEDIKHAMKVIVMKCIVAILAMALFAIAFNLLAGTLFA